MNANSPMVAMLPAPRSAFAGVVGWLLGCVLLLGASVVQAQMLAHQGLPDHGDDKYRFWIDVNADGRDDFCIFRGNSLVCHLTKPTGIEVLTVPSVFGSSPQFEAFSIRWSDLNGDGFVDLCYTLVTDSTSYGGGAVVGRQLTCRRGPQFTQEMLALPFIASPSSVTNSPENPGWASAIDSQDLTDLHLADVSGDGLPDLCYFYRQYGQADSLRCRIASLANPDRSDSALSYLPESASWTRAVVRGSTLWPQGFYDFNGDGLGDFCRLTEGQSSTAFVRCTLAGSEGFIGEAVTPVRVAAPHKEGAAFVDVNGDGKIDFCRIDGAAATAHLRCTMSNGRTWEHVGTAAISPTTDRTSPYLGDNGHFRARWWVDINGDGLPDFCRVSEPYDPVGNGWTNMVAPMLCRLNRGDYKAPGSTTVDRVVFALDDIRINDVNLGVSNGGRAFCDALGTGVATFCRATYAQVASGTSFCWPQEMPDMPLVCYEPSVTNVSGILVGFSPEVQARPPLLTAYRDGAGAETRITYLGLTSPLVYARSDVLANPERRALLLQPRSQVVYETRAFVADGSAMPRALTGNARYMYRDMRSDHMAGSRGFRERWIFNESSNTFEHVIFFQALGNEPGSVKDDLREIGMVRCQERFAVQGGLIPAPPSGGADRAHYMRATMERAQSAARPPQSNAGLCAMGDINPSAEFPFVLVHSSSNLPAATTPDNPRFKYTGGSTTLAWDWTGATRVPLPSSSSATTMDDLGNVLTLEQATPATTTPAAARWRKVTVNTYFTDEALKTSWTLGRLKRSDVTAYAPTPEAQLAVLPSKAGNAAHATLMSPPPNGPASPPSPVNPAVWAAIQMLLLED